MQEPPLVSVVVPVYNEEATIPVLHERVTSALERIDPPVRHELIAVDDGSTDATAALLADLCAAEPRVKVVRLSRNFGHQAAITAGIDHARGDAVVVIDADLQDPPEVIADMVARWREGCHVVYGQRIHRAGERRARLWVTARFYRLLGRIADTPIPLDTGDFRLVDRRVVDVLRDDLRESNRYLRGLVAWVGFRQAAVPFSREPRYAGEAKYSVAKLATLALDGITSFSVKPLRLALKAGLVVVAAALVYAGLIVVQRLAFPETAPQGWPSVMVAVLFLGGVQLLSLGLMGEYVGRIYRETKRRPLYIIEERVNFDRGAPR